MTAGGSAADEARRLRGLAAEHERLARELRESSTRYELASSTEARTFHVLEPLAAAGYHLLADRRWPGSRRAQVDLVLVGPGGVFIVDTKAWKDVRIEHGRIRRGDADVTDDLETLTDLAELARTELARVGLPAGEVRVLVVLAGRHGVDARVGGVRVVGEGDVRRVVADHRTRLGADQVALVLAAASELFCEIRSEPADQSPRTTDPETPPDGSGTLWTMNPFVTPRDVMVSTVNHEMKKLGQRLGAALVGALAIADAAPHGPRPASPGTAPAAASASPAPHDGPSLAYAPSFEVADVLDDLERCLTTEPIEDWMVFLHPTQAQLVARSFNGPARIRGAAGTGKTVVGLHRAAHLARRSGGRVLFTTYVRTLPDVLGQLLRRMAPDVADRIDFTGTHAWARRLLWERRVPFNLNPEAATEAMRSAFRRTGGPLLQAGLPRRYWAEEVEVVIKGRGVADFDTYAGLARTGRRRPLGVELRRAVWDLHEAYAAELRKRRVHDFADIVLLAEAELRREPAPYAAVVVDEVQDLTCAMVRMLHAVTGDRPDGLTLIGDGQQSIYPGGYTLSEAGVSVVGRGVVLGVNYRNTAEVLRLATDLVHRTQVTDIESGTSLRDACTDVVRHGRAPQVCRYVDRADRDRQVVARLREVVGEGVAYGNVGVLCPTRHAAKEVLTLLMRSGVPVIDLEQYVGRPVDRVKVGTVKRAKGLEFAQVLVVDVDPWLLGDTTPEGADPERCDLLRRELYVAMTRARDGLWLGVREVSPRRPEPAQSGADLDSHPPLTLEPATAKG